MERAFVIAWLCVCLFSLSVIGSGCTPRTKTAAGPSPAPETRRPPQRLWEGERAKVVVMEFDNRVRLHPKGKTQVIPDVFGKSMQRYLVKGLHQTEQFAVVKNSRTTRTLRESDFTSAGQMKRKTLVKMGPLEGAEFLITGSVTAYQLSQESIKAGTDEDPFFAEPAMPGSSPNAPLVKKMFANLPTAKQDRIVIGLSLIDGTTGKTIGSTIVEGTVPEFGIQADRFFEEQLLRTSGSLRTPMQKALRVCTMKAVHWIAETGLAYRRQVALRSVPPSSSVKEKPALVKKPLAEKRNNKNQVFAPQSAKNPESTERSMVETPDAEKPTTKKPLAEKPVAEKPMTEKPLPKQEAPQSEEWGQ